MAALHIFKKTQKPATKQPKAAKQAGPPQSGKASLGGEAEKQQEKDVKKNVAVVAGDSQLVRPHITEKATVLAGKNQYVFVVQTDAAKKEIEKSVEEMYGVHVERVRTVTVRPKKVRLGRTKGVKKGYKKAIVKIQEGQSIEILPT